MSDLKRMVWYPTTEENIKRIPKTYRARVIVYSPLYLNDMTMTYRFVDVQFVSKTDVTHFCIVDTPENMQDYYMRD